MDSVKSIYQTLYRIYNKHRRRYRENSCDSQQMCLMWSTDDPPDDIMETEPFRDMEAAFDICIDNDDDAEELYNMKLKEAAEKISKMQKAKSNRKNQS